MKKLPCTVDFRFTGNLEKLNRELIEHEFLRCYNEYVAICNDGLTERLNKEFFDAHPEKDNVWNDPDYNCFMAGNYTKYAASKVKSTLMHFYVDPEEVNLIGVLNSDPTITIDMFIKLERLAFQKD